MVPLCLLGEAETSLHQRSRYAWSTYWCLYVEKYSNPLAIKGKIPEQQIAWIDLLNCFPQFAAIMYTQFKHHTEETGLPIVTSVFWTPVNYSELGVTARSTPTLYELIKRAIKQTVDLCYPPCSHG
jgi:hypothetical protein